MHFNCAKSCGRCGCQVSFSELLICDYLYCQIWAAKEEEADVSCKNCCTTTYYCGLDPREPADAATIRLTGETPKCVDPTDNTAVCYR